MLLIVMEKWDRGLRYRSKFPSKDILFRNIFTIPDIQGSVEREAMNKTLLGPSEEADSNVQGYVEDEDDENENDDDDAEQTVSRAITPGYV